MKERKLKKYWYIMINYGPGWVCDGRFEDEQLAKAYYRFYKAQYEYIHDCDIPSDDPRVPKMKLESEYEYDPLFAF